MGEKVDTNVWHNNIILEEIESQVGRAPRLPACAPSVEGRGEVR